MNHSEQILQARLGSDYSQIRRVKLREANKSLPQVSTYVGRDFRTGSRAWIGMDGSKSYGRFLSNSQPQDAVYFPGSLGRDGIAIQKPAG